MYYSGDMCTSADTGQMPLRHAVLPVPVIDWTAVVKADNPTREPTRGRLRELRKKYRMSGGVTVWRRGRRGLHGRATYYSVLSALAARSRQDGHGEEAAALESAAAQVEGQFSERLEQFLSNHTLAQLPQAEFFDELTTVTAQRLANWSGLLQALLAAAKVYEMEGDVAHLEGSSPRGDPVAVDLPRALLERQSLKSGDLVWIFSRIVGDAVLVELLPAVRVQMRSGGSEQERTLLSALVDVEAREGRLGEESDGLTDEERAEYAERFNATVGADLTGGELSALRADAAAGRIVRRRLYPAG
jgi:hypothetical protein